MASYGIPEPIIIAIKVVYTNTMAQVVTEDGNTDFFGLMETNVWTKVSGKTSAQLRNAPYQRHRTEPPGPQNGDVKP